MTMEQEVGKKTTYKIGISMSVMLSTAFSPDDGHGYWLMVTRWL